MVTLHDLTNFSGNRGEDALQWYKSFINATSPLGERAMLSNFPLYLEPDSPAQVWCDELPKEVLSSWTVLDRNFRRTWLHQGVLAESRERFQNHHLTDEAIFSSASIDFSAMKRTIVDWAKNHAQLGAATKFDDAYLIQATIPRLPAFIRAFVKYKINPPMTFRSLCSKIQEITEPVLEFEQLRRQEASADWQAEISRKQDDMFEIVKEIQVAIEERLLSKSEENIQWQHADGSKMVETTRTALETLPDYTADEDASTLFFPSDTWLSETVQVSVAKTGMIEMVKELIKSLRKQKPSAITINAAYMMNIGLMHYCGAVNAASQFRPNTIAGQAGSKSTLLQALYQVKYQASNGSSDVTVIAKTWQSLSDTSNSTIPSECVYRPNHVHADYLDNTSYPLKSNNFPYYGGFAKLGYGRTFPWLGASSYDTAIYLLLSIYLEEQSPNDHMPYKQAAVASANWIMKWAFDENAQLVKDFTWDMYRVQVWGTPSLSPHITGIFIEGLCVLASVTGEQKWRTLAINICDAAMAYRDWHNDEGIFNYVSGSGALPVDESNAFRGLLIRGLLVAYQRSPDNEKLRHKIRTYINLQFNGLRQYAYDHGSYAMRSIGPYVGHNVDAEMASLDLLMAAVVVNHY